MIKLEVYIGVTNSEIHEVELTVELAEKEYVALKKNEQRRIHKVYA